MSKKYQTYYTKQQVVAEPLATYGIRASRPLVEDIVTSRESVMQHTISVDEYFDELISKIHQDYANL